jgi:hypothetical protein
MRFIESHSGGPYCPPLGIRFPVVFKVVQSMTAADLERLGEDEVEPFVGAVHYTIGDEREIASSFPGEITVTPLSGADPDPEAPTIIVRYHPSQAHADGHTQAIFDLFDCPHDDDRDDVPANPTTTSETGRTADGIFTLLLRPTHRADAAQPGPLLIYLADYEAHPYRPPPANMASWYLALAPDGSEVRLADEALPSAGPGP